MVSMKDIARECGVSVATVSKALNGQDDISQDTKEKVREAAQRMGYYPNLAARALKTKKTHNIGVLFADEAHSGLTHEYFSSVLDSFKVATEERGYDITFINPNVGRQEMSYLEHCRYRGIDGIIVACVDHENLDVSELISSDIPAVTIDYVYHNCTSVVSDNVTGMEDLVNYIVSLGHRDIAYIHGQLASAVTKDRLASFYNTLESLEIEVKEGFLRTADYLDVSEAEKITKELLALKNKPTCIMYADDTALIGGLNAIRGMGLEVSKDVSVAGYDGSKLSQILEPRLTTIKQDTKKIGELAAKELIRKIEEPKRAVTKHIVVPGKLLIGNSVATPEYNFTKNT